MTTNELTKLAVTIGVIIGMAAPTVASFIGCVSTVSIESITRQAVIKRLKICGALLLASLSCGLFILIMVTGGLRAWSAAPLVCTIIGGVVTGMLFLGVFENLDDDVLVAVPSDLSSLR